MVLLIELIGVIGVSLMLVFRFGGPRWCATWGQVLVMVSFTLISYALLRAHAYWVGAGAAIAVLMQVVGTARGLIRRHREAAGVQ